MNLFKNKKILVTGGTGSLGKELVWDLLKNHEDSVRFLLGDVRDKERLNRATENIDIIFHTAALKHVMACEYNPFEAVKTNVLGMQNIGDVMKQMPSLTPLFIQHIKLWGTIIITNSILVGLKSTKLLQQGTAS